jgi:hypothetical protein
MQKSCEEGVYSNLDGCHIAIIPSYLSEMSSFPSQEDGCVGFGLEEHDCCEDGPRNDERDPFAPSPDHKR